MFSCGRRPARRHQTERTSDASVLRPARKQIRARPSTTQRSAGLALHAPRRGRSVPLRCRVLPRSTARMAPLRLQRLRRSGPDARKERPRRALRPLTRDRHARGTECCTHRASDRRARLAVFPVEARAEATTFFDTRQAKGDRARTSSPRNWSGSNEDPGPLGRTRAERVEPCSVAARTVQAHQPRRTASRFPKNSSLCC